MTTSHRVIRAALLFTVGSMFKAFERFRMGRSEKKMAPHVSLRLIDEIGCSAEKHYAPTHHICGSCSQQTSSQITLACFRQSEVQLHEYGPNLFKRFLLSVSQSLAFSPIFFRSYFFLFFGFFSLFLSLLSFTYFSKLIFVRHKAK